MKARSSTTPWALGLVVATVLVLGATRWSLSSRSPLGGPQSPHVPLLSSAVIVCDGSTPDGPPNVIVKTSEVRREGVVPLLTAFEGPSGKLLWSTDLVGPISTSPIACFGRTLLEASRSALAAYDLPTGRRLWQHALPETVVDFCVDPHGQASLVAADKQVYGIALETGALSPTPSDPSPCVHPPMLDAHPHPGPGVDLWWNISASADPGGRRLHVENTDGMSIQQLWREGPADLLLAIAQKWPGSRTPMLAAVSATGTVRWRAELPIKDPLGASTQAPAVSLRGAHVITTFLHEVDKQYIVTSWDLPTGRRHWQSAIPQESKRLIPTAKHDVQVTDKRVCEGVAQNDRYVFVACSNTLQAFAVADGKRLWSVDSP